MPRQRLFPPPLHPDTQKPLSSHGQATHTINTLNGRITLKRRRYDGPGADPVYPLDSWLDRAEDTISLGLRELVCRLNLPSPSFAKLAQNLQHASSLRVSAETARQIVLHEGQAVRRAADQGELILDWSASDCPAAAPPTSADSGSQNTPAASSAETTPRYRIYVGCDGVTIPHVTDAEKQLRRKNIVKKRGRSGQRRAVLPRRKIGADQKFKEFKIVTFYDDGVNHRLVSVTRQDCHEAGRWMRRDAARVGLDQADDKVAIVDGADWIRRQLQGQSLPLDAVVLDFYHLSENVHKAKRAVYGEESGELSAGRAWADRILHIAKHEGYEALREALQSWKGEVRGVKKRRAAEQLLNYVTDRREMIVYPECQKEGRQMGSGPTESMCKVTTQRLKGRGRRWDGDNAENVMALEALEQSGLWDSYWKAKLNLAA